MNFDYDALLDHCIDSLLRSDSAAVDECLQHLPAHYYIFLFLRLNTMNDMQLQQCLSQLATNSLNIQTLSKQTPVTGLCCDALKEYNFPRCKIWTDSGLVNFEQLYVAWDNMLDTISPTTIEQGVVFFSQLPYYSAQANMVWNKMFELWLRQITNKRFSMPSSPNFAAYVSEVSKAFECVMAQAYDPVKSELFWRCAATLDATDATDTFLRGLVDQGFDFHRPSYPFGLTDDDSGEFINHIEHRLFQLQGERLKRLAGIEDSGNDSERRKI